MDNIVDDAYNEGGEDERRNVLNDNTSTDDVNVLCNDLKNIEDDGVHYNKADPKRNDDDRAENKSEYRLQEEGEQGENDRNEDDRDPITAQAEARDEFVRHPQRKRVASYYYE